MMIKSFVVVTRHEKSSDLCTMVCEECFDLVAQRQFVGSGAIIVFSSAYCIHYLMFPYLELVTNNKSAIN